MRDKCRAGKLIRPGLRVLCKLFVFNTGSGWFSGDLRYFLTLAAYEHIWYVVLSDFSTRQVYPCLTAATLYHRSVSIRLSAETCYHFIFYKAKHTHVDNIDLISWTSKHRMAPSIHETGCAVWNIAMWICCGIFLMLYFTSRVLP